MAIIDYLLNTEDDDVITTEGDDGLIAVSVSDNPNALTYGLSIDWDGDGEHDVENEADRIVRWSCDRGRDKIFKPSGNGFNPYEIGTLTIELDNFDGRYDPWNTDSPLYGDIMPGRNMSFKVAVYNSTNIFDFTPYFIFTGTIVDIQVNGRNNTVNLICEDGWRYLADQEYFREPLTTYISGVGFEVFQILDWGLKWDYHTDTYIEVDGVGYPWGTNYTFGDTYRNLPRHWWHDGTAKSAIEMITFGSLGRSFVGADGSYNFIDFEEEDAVELSLDEDKLLKNIYLPTPWENLRSEVVLKGSNNFWYGNQVVATLQEPIKIPAGETVEFTLRYSYEDIQNTISTKIISLDMEAFANSDGTGTDITSDIEEDITPYVYHASVIATNNGGTSGYITKFDITGEALEVNERVERFESTSYYRAASFILENPWLSVTAVGSTDHIEETITTSWDRDRLDLVGLTLVDYLSDVKACPVIQLRGRWTEQFSIEIEDTIALTIGTLGIDDNYWVSKISHESILSTQDILTTVWLYPILEPLLV